MDLEALHIQKSKNFYNEKNVKIAKWTQVFKDFTNSNNVEVLNPFNCELQLRDTYSSIKSQLADLMT